MSHGKFIVIHGIAFHVILKCMTSPTRTDRPFSRHSHCVFYKVFHCNIVCNVIHLILVYCHLTSHIRYTCNLRNVLRKLYSNSSVTLKCVIDCSARFMYCNIIRHNIAENWHMVLYSNVLYHIIIWIVKMYNACNMLPCTTT